MFKKTAIVAGLGLALSAGAQADYRWELGAGYSESSIDTELRTPAGNASDDVDAEVWDVYGTWYMETVDTSKGPLGEAAFLVEDFVPQRIGMELSSETAYLDPEREAAADVLVGLVAAPVDALQASGELAALSGSPVEVLIDTLLGKPADQGG